MHYGMPPASGRSRRVSVQSQISSLNLPSLQVELEVARKTFKWTRTYHAESRWRCPGQIQVTQAGQAWVTVPVSWCGPGRYRASDLLAPRLGVGWKGQGHGGGRPEGPAEPVHGQTSRWRPLPGSVTASAGAMTVTANAGASSSTASDRAPRLGVIQIPLAAFCTTGRLCGHCPAPRPPRGQSMICPGQTRSAEQRDHLHHWQIILDWTCWFHSIQHNLPLSRRGRQPWLRGTAPGHSGWKGGAAAAALLNDRALASHWKAHQAYLDAFQSCSPSSESSSSPFPFPSPHIPPDHCVCEASQPDACDHDPSRKLQVDDSLASSGPFLSNSDSY